PAEEHLVGGGAPAIEEPCLRQQRGPGAHGHGDLEAGSALADPADETLVVDLGPRTDPAGNQEQIEPGAVVEAVVGMHAGAVGASERSGLLGDSQQPDLVRHVPEHLEWSEEVEHLETLVEQRSQRPYHGNPPLTRRYEAPRTAARTTTGQVLPSPAIDSGWL